MSIYDDMSMSELVGHYNNLANAQDKKWVSGFKSLSEGREACARMEAGDDPATDVSTDDTPAAKAQKYNTSGKRGPNQGIGVYAKEQIAAGKTNEEILADIKEKFPEAKTSIASVAYYRSTLKKGTAASKGRAKASPEALRAKAQELFRQAAELEETTAESEVVSTAATAAKAAEKAEKAKAKAAQAQAEAEAAVEAAEKASAKAAEVAAVKAAKMPESVEA